MKRIYKWGGRGNKYPDCPYDFDFIEGCKTGLVVWWDEYNFCLDLNKLPVGNTHCKNGEK